MFFIPQTSILPDGERELALLPSSGGVVPPYRLSGAPADAPVRNLITTESSLAYRFHQAAPLHPSAVSVGRQVFVKLSYFWRFLVDGAVPGQGQQRKEKPNT